MIFFWENACGIRCQGEGVARDVSRVGAYVLSATRPPLRSEVEMFFSEDSRPEALLRGQMKVLRVDDQLASFALAGQVNS